MNLYFILVVHWLRLTVVTSQTTSQTLTPTAAMSRKSVFIESNTQPMFIETNTEPQEKPKAKMRQAWVWEKARVRSGDLPKDPESDWEEKIATRDTIFCYECYKCGDKPLIPEISNEICHTRESCIVLITGDNDTFRQCESCNYWRQLSQRHGVQLKECHECYTDWCNDLSVMANKQIGSVLDSNKEVNKDKATKKIKKIANKMKQNISTSTTIDNKYMYTTRKKYRLRIPLKRSGPEVVARRCWECIRTCDPETVKNVSCNVTGCYKATVKLVNTSENYVFTVDDGGCGSCQNRQDAYNRFSYNNPNVSLVTFECVECVENLCNFSSGEIRSTVDIALQIQSTVALLCYAFFALLV